MFLPAGRTPDTAPLFEAVLDDPYSPAEWVDRAALGLAAAQGHEASDRIQDHLWKRIRNGSTGSSRDVATRDLIRSLHLADPDAFGMFFAGVLESPDVAARTKATIIREMAEIGHRAMETAAAGTLSRPEDPRFALYLSVFARSGLSDPENVDHVLDALAGPSEAGFRFDITRTLSRSPLNPAQVERVAVLRGAENDARNRALLGLALARSDPLPADIGDRLATESLSSLDTLLETTGGWGHADFDSLLSFQAAVEVAGRLAPQEDLRPRIPWLARFLEDVQAEEMLPVRHEIVLVLGPYAGDRGVFRAAKVLLGRRTEDIELRRAAAALVVASGDPSQIEVLRGILATEQEDWQFEQILTVATSRLSPGDSRLLVAGLREMIPNGPMRWILDQQFPEHDE